MKRFMKRIEEILEAGGIKKDIALLAVSGVALLVSIFDLVPLPFDAAWISVILCGIPIILEAVIGLVTAFDIKADVLVSIALIASLCIGEDFAAGEVVFIMQLGALLEDLTVAKARAGIEKLVRLTPQNGTGDQKREGRNGFGGKSACRRYPADTSRRDNSCGRGDLFRADFNKPGSYDGGIYACR